MAANKRINLESLVTKEELKQFNDIRVAELPENIEELGEGAYGYVSLFRFKDGSLFAGKRPKINLFNKSLEDERQMEKRLISAIGEIKILHQLSHERIIKVIGFYLDQGQMIIFMEHMRGSVKDEINVKKNLSEMEAMNYFTQAAEGLVYLHGQKPKAIIHRDIKCENLLLTAQYNIKLADFGLATDLTLTSRSKTDFSHAPTSCAGTCLFQAPEIIRNMNQPEAYGRKSDIWSLACTLVQMINGEPPYADLSLYEFIQRSSPTAQNPLRYSGNVLPAASNAVRTLLSFLFIIDSKSRPNATEVLNLAHDAATIITNGITDDRAQYRIGEMYMNGRGVQRSYTEAIKWFRKSAEQGNSGAQCNLGIIYEKGQGLPLSDEEAVKWYRKSAEQENPNAQFNLGFMYLNGRGAPQSDEEAVKWFRKAAEQGGEYAQLHLGYMYEKGKGVPQSVEEAVKWFTKSAEQGNAFAKSSLINMCEKDKDVPPSDEEAMKWSRTLIQEKTPDMLFNMGLFFDSGVSVPQSPDKALLLFRKAAEQGNADAQHQLGAKYYSGINVPQSYDEAMKWFKKAAEQGKVFSQFTIGHIYETGGGVPQSFGEAAKWYRKAAEQGYAIAQDRFGDMYQNGQGVPQSFGEAAKWYRRAAEQGNAGAQYSLGLMYLNGRGVPQSDGEAIKWFRNAAEQQNEDALLKLSEMSLKCQGIPNNITRFI